MVKGALLRIKNYAVLSILVLSKSFLCAQDTLLVKGTIDTYYAYNVRNTSAQDLGIYISSNAINALDINYAAIELTKKYKDNTFYISPAFGRYMTNNYKNEHIALRWLAESYWQRTLTENQTITLGVFSSPFSPENWKSSEQLFYSRSLAPEYVPYYLSGVKWRINCSPGLTFTPMLVNGWQHISDQKPSIAWSSLMEFKWKNFSLNWTSFFGKEAGLDHQKEWRILNDVNATLKVANKIWVQSCAYLGKQKSLFEWRTWWQINSGIKFQYHQRSSCGLRGELFRDHTGVFFDGNNSQIFVLTGYWDFKVSENLIYRMEFKRLDNNKFDKSKWFGFLNLTLGF